MPTQKTGLDRQAFRKNLRRLADARIIEAKHKSRSGDASSLYNFSRPFGLEDLTRVDPIVRDLVDTPAFQRLSEIRFLGGIDYLLVASPNGSGISTRYSRFQHSLGVAALAAIYADRTELSEKDRKLILSAALLHDIGHCPLSHTLEPVFEEYFSINHHFATAEIIFGRAKIGSEVSKVLRAHGVMADELVELLDGKLDQFDGFFSGPINFDTIEGILRSWAYAGYEERFPSPSVVVGAAIDRIGDDDREIVDEFWAYKDRVYHYLIRSPRGVVADLLCQKALRQDIASIRASDFLTTERSLFKKSPSLRSLINSGLSWPRLDQIVDAPITYQSRRFFIDDAGDFFAHSDRTRYKQVKEAKTIPAGVALSGIHEGGNAYDRRLHSREGLFGGETPGTSSRPK